MDISFAGKNIAVTGGIKEHLNEKLGRFVRYVPRLVEAHVVLKKEKYIYEAEITVLGKNLHVFGDGRSKENIYTAIDLSCDRVEKQLKKIRGKAKSHKGSKAVSAARGELAEKLNQPARTENPRRKPRIVPVEDYDVKPMAVEEAHLQLGIGSQDFLVFMNAETQKVNVIYRRKDGHHGLIEPVY